MECIELPIHPDFQKIYQNFIDQYGEEEGENNYYAWLNKQGFDDTKPMPKKESLSWVGKFKEACDLIEVGFEYVTGGYNDGGKIFRKRN